MPNDRESAFSDEEAEHTYLSRVLDAVHAEMTLSRASQKAAKDKVVESRRYMWDNLSHARPDANDLEGIVNIYQVRREMNWEEKELSLEAAKLRRLERQADSPYFGRIDFIEKGSSRVEAVYVGTFALMSRRDREALVYDWRAPISSMFYESEVGPASYACPAGLVEGEVVLKRQYRIRDGAMEFMFQSSVKIDDDVLQEVLARATDERMRTIVSSIQREQNQAIRDDEHKLLVVQGGAGSGKTSVALHRAAYLLYHNRESMTATSILIFSPNHIFSDYISNVLPELGEDNVGQATWADYARTALGATGVLEDWSDQMEYLLADRGSRRTEVRGASIRLKGSAAFADALVGLVGEYAKSRDFRDIRAGSEVILSAVEQRRLFMEEYSFLPPLRRLDKLARRAEAVVEEWARAKRLALEEQLEESDGWLPAGERKKRVRETVRDMVISAREHIGNAFSGNWRQAYLDIFRNAGKLAKLLGGTASLEEVRAICAFTLDSFGAGRMDFEDAAPMLYYRNLVSGYEERPDIKHVIVDEAQDYTVAQFRVMRQQFTWASFTVLGDPNQGVNPYSAADNLEAVARELGITRAAVLRLSRTYRSTSDIAEFAAQILPPGADVPEAIRRPGDRPRVVAVKQVSDLPTAVMKQIDELRALGCESIGVICRTATEAAHAHGALGVTAGGERLHLAHSTDDGLPGRFVVLPSYLAKGLEFDGVVLWNADAASYDEPDRKLLYTACTRALHALRICHAGERSRLLAFAEEGAAD